MSLLILGGTADARKMATQLFIDGLPLIYSVAGLVRVPKVDCQIVSGGFRQRGGLVHYIRQQGITAILDATHPYASSMSQQAAQAAELCQLPYWRFNRAAWQPEPDDNWQYFSQWSSLVTDLQPYNTIFFTLGQLEQDLFTELTRLTQFTQRHLVVRTAVSPKINLLSNMQWVKAIGPFNLTEELALLKKHKVEALVTKNSGGEATVAKLAAARALNIPVFMQTRPELPTAEQSFSDLVSCQQFILAQDFLFNS